MNMQLNQKAQFRPAVYFVVMFGYAVAVVSIAAAIFSELPLSSFGFCVAFVSAIIEGCEWRYIATHLGMVALCEAQQRQEAEAMMRAEREARLRSTP